MNEYKLPKIDFQSFKYSNITAKQKSTTQFQCKLARTNLISSKTKSIEASRFNPETVSELNEKFSIQWQNKHTLRREKANIITLAAVRRNKPLTEYDLSSWGKK